MGSQGGEDSRGRGGTETGGVWDERGRQSDHWRTLQPHIRAQINQEGWTQSGREWGRQSGGERSRLRNPGLQLGEIKPQTSD